MVTRLLFVLLLAGNIGVAAWLWLAPRPGASLPPATDPGVPALVLLAERDALPAAELASAPRSAADAARDRCLRIGPFATQADLRRAMATLTPRVERIQFRESRQTQSRGFAVFLPPPETRERALSIARELSARGVRDYYVVTAGEQQNSISLGLFRERMNAERRREEITALGLSPQIAERIEELPAYWLDFALAPGNALDWRDAVPDPMGIGEQAIPCF